jgi:predicted nucleic acid-binding protein
VIVVSNTSPITNLAAVGQLELLRQLYEKILVPQAVYDELTRLPGQPGGAEVQSCDWLLVRSPANRARVVSLLEDLDAGEAEAIALAIESEADLLLIDERIGRRVAAALNLKSIGLLGVLVEAKHHQLLPAIGPLIDDLIHKAGFRIGEGLRRVVLRSAGET